MLEIYLFIDPLNRHCYDAEKVINKLSQKLKSNVSVRFLTMLNIRVVNDLATCTPEKAVDHELPFKVILDSKAASFQGKRFGRNFLMDLQHEILDNAEDYCDDLVLELAEKNGLDCDMFREDRRSNLAKKMFRADQRVANEMSVKTPASTVLFNSAVDGNGLLIKDYDYNSLYNFCSRSISSAKHFEELAKPTDPNSTVVQFVNLGRM
ncbi:DsbA family protein [Lentilactobacillus kisonensis]|uniref:Dithiol-disulfide isomerase n=1 Tax=Lentilactobacillus kisonensis DSM 19906 = JCM 15041 TaxID=1423766 RepID=A0A0R1NJK3_9LACO|nr:DsbA family protein [Lentilactobacillus kisonensis]KRL20422.1 hypothetical protein FC98_GL001509 [Lentilactobacillus kisonensis DSM 19906 = JCM 15041]